MRFTKMHGAGNDYVYVNGFAETIDNPSELAIRVSDRHFGIGSDGLILVMPSDKADFRMRMFNADGSESAMCGNGVRCIGRYVYEHGLTDQTNFTVETGGGVRAIRLTLRDGRVDGVRVDMGLPTLTRRASGRGYGVRLGNDHMVYLVNEDPFAWEDFDQRAAPLCTALDANIEYVLPLSPSRIRVRVFERGSGETLACGSGACASALIAHQEGLSDAHSVVEMRGGDLIVDIDPADDDRIYLSGPTVTVFEGDLLG